MEQNQTHEWELIWSDNGHERVKSFAKVRDAYVFIDTLAEGTRFQIAHIDDLRPEWDREQYTRAIAKLTRKLADAADMAHDEFLLCLLNCRQLRAARRWMPL